MRRISTAAVVLTAGLLLGACSSEDTSASEPAAGSSSPAPSEDTPTDTPTDDTSASADTEEGSGGDVPADALPGLALTAADFPAPYAFQELPPGALEAGSEAIGGAIAGAEYTPAECGNASQATQGADLTQSGVAIAADQSSQTTVVSVLSPEVEQTVDFEELAETCATFTFSLTGPDGSAFEGDATLELLPEPEVEADAARAAATTVTVSLGGQQQTVSSVIYAAELRGVSVIASASGFGGGEIDNAVLEDLLTTGLDKVRAAP